MILRFYNFEEYKYNGRPQCQSDRNWVMNLEIYDWEIEARSSKFVLWADEKIIKNTLLVPMIFTGRAEK